MNIRQTLRASSLFVALSAVLAPIAACAPESPDGTEEETNESEARAVSVDTVYIVTGQDFRKCAYPMCGGVYVKAVNKAKTTCLDGTKQPECYVAEIDFSSIGLSDDETADLRGRATAGQVLVSGQFGTVQNSGIAKLVANKALDAHTDAAPTGSFYLLSSSGIVCITTPCPSITAKTINQTTTKTIHEVDFSALGLTDEEIGAASTQIHESSLVVSGTIKTKNNVKKLVLSQYFETVEPAAPAQQLCLADDDCDAGSFCDMSVCLSSCKPGMVCPAVCYGACTVGEPPTPGGSCVNSCGDASADLSCYCDDVCSYYGDCCADYTSACK